MTQLDERRPFEARLGTVLRERWRLVELLGVGGMSVVYGAEHRNGRPLAIKMLRPELAADSTIAERFLSEGYVANKVGHPGVVAILDDDRTEDGLPFLVMERLDGESLDRRAQRGPLSAQEVLVVADRVLDALGAAHAKGVLHRDIKPENIFLTTHREVRLLDFGIARCQEVTSGKSGTRVGAVMGTPAYMPPEQARGEWGRVDERSDLFSLGATMLALLTGEPPRKADTPNLELLDAMSKPLPRVADVQPHVPAAVAELIDRAVCFAREDRWPNATSMRDAVRRAWTETGANQDLQTALEVPARASGPGPMLEPRSATPLARKEAAATTARPVTTPTSSASSPDDAKVPIWARLTTPKGAALGGILCLAAAVAIFWPRPRAASPAAAPTATTSVEAKPPPAKDVLPELPTLAPAELPSTEIAVESLPSASPPVVPHRTPSQGLPAPAVSAAPAAAPAARAPRNPSLPQPSAPVMNPLERRH